MKSIRQTIWAKRELPNKSASDDKKKTRRRKKFIKIILATNFGDKSDENRHHNGKSNRSTLSANAYQFDSTRTRQKPKRKKKKTVFSSDVSQEWLNVRHRLVYGLCQVWVDWHSMGSHLCGGEEEHTVSKMSLSSVGSSNSQKMFVSRNLCGNGNCVICLYGIIRTLCIVFGRFLEFGCFFSWFVWAQFCSEHTLTNRQYILDLLRKLFIEWQWRWWLRRRQRSVSVCVVCTWVRCS